MNNKTRIILADPSEEFRILMRQVMEQEGDFEVIGSTGSGAEAMELVASRQPDVLVTEVVLPELDGFALLRRVKELPHPPQVVVVSAFCSQRTVREAAELVGLSEDMLAQSPFELSGGQKRRVAIAGVIAMEPKVLILDEPTAGLDPRGREAVLAQIRAYHERRGTTVILVSHSMEEIARNAGRIVVFCDSHILMQGTPREVFARAEELERVGLDVPQVTKIAGELRRCGLPIDPAVYTIEDLKAELLALKGGHAAC